MTSAPRQNVWFHCPQPRPHAAVRLFCFPYAGGGISIYRSWANELCPDVEVCAVQLPGHDFRMREQPYADMRMLVAALADGLAHKLDTPYAFFGHSLGALIAYELVRHIRRQGGNPPVHLFASARRAPQLPARYPLCHQLPDSAFVEAVVNRYNGIPQSILDDPDLMRLFLPMLRADFALAETYQYVEGEPLDEPITIFGGVDDAMVKPAELTAWKYVTRGSMDLHMMPGGHLFVQNAPKALLQVVARAL
jgi:medium-chain acyl-[acyl-carrier-protein] hydrolase